VCASTAHASPASVRWTLARGVFPDRPQAAIPSVSPGFAHVPTGGPPGPASPITAVLGVALVSARVATSGSRSRRLPRPSMSRARRSAARETSDRRREDSVHRDCARQRTTQRRLQPRSMPKLALVVGQFDRRILTGLNGRFSAEQADQEGPACRPDPRATRVRQGRTSRFWRAGPSQTEDRVCLTRTYWPTTTSLICITGVRSV